MAGELIAEEGALLKNGRRRGRDRSPWGKFKGLPAPYPLILHMLDTAAMALRLWDDYLTASQRAAVCRGLGLAEEPERARALVGFWAGLHDIGKLSPAFQKSDMAAWSGLSHALLSDLGAAGGERLGHAEAGMRGAPAVLQPLGYADEGGPRSPLRCVAQIVGGHHGRFQPLDDQVVRNDCYLELLGGGSWADLRSEYTCLVDELLGHPQPPAKVSVPAAVLVTGVVILADWLVSQEDYLKARQQKSAMTEEDHFEQAWAASRVLLERAGLAPVELARRGFTEVHGIPDPNPLQRSLMAELGAAEQQGPGIALVTAATGDGKTETALEAERILSARSGTRGLAFLLPTMATSDQMFKRVAGFVQRQCDAAPSVTLTHSMAWLSTAYSDELLDGGAEVLSCDQDGEPPDGSKRSGPAQWLRGGKRALLAQFTVGTIDQALMAVLPVKHNALRLLALSGRTVIVDEAHAYDPYMQVLLGRLLHWLGAYGCPVVLLSATLPRSVSDRLIREYLIGSGAVTRRGARTLSFHAPYPGWLFVDAATGTALPMSQGMQEAQIRHRSSQLRLERYPVRHIAPDNGPEGRPLPEDARLSRIGALLEPVFSPEGGCVLVVCTTVDDAQQTYAWLRDRIARRGLDSEDVELLHARLPGDVREERSGGIAGLLGRSGKRPARRIVVATQVVEQSLDLDADLVISDLAPLALLLQRAGRCWRHEDWWAVSGTRPRHRPAWSGGPRLAVLDPLDEAGSPPKHWGEVYHPYLLAATSEVLRDRDGSTLKIPQEVQSLVEQVHGDGATVAGQGLYAWDNPQLSVLKVSHDGEKLAQESVGAIVAVPTPTKVAGLEALSRFDIADDEWEAATRLGADSLRVLCCFDHAGRVTLDAAGEIPLPEPEEGHRLSTAQVRAVMRRTIPVRADWLANRGPEHAPPPSWAKHPMLADLVLLRQPVVDGAATAIQIGGRTFRLDAQLGLVRSRTVGSQSEAPTSAGKT